MIKYNLQNINDWNFGDDNIAKVYYDNAVCYYKVISSGSTPTYDLCYAVVDDISQYQETEFEDVFDKTTEKWYKLNNLNQYEEYGLYGSGLTITTYDGKLTVDGSDEYIYSSGSWVYVGEVSGGTAQLPDVPFTVNYNAKNYDASTQTFAKTDGQLANTDVTITGGTLTAHDGYVTVPSNSRGVISGYDSYFNRTNSAPNLTIISKQRTEGNSCHMFANRNAHGSSNYNWMYRPYYNKLTLHGSSEQGSVAVTTQPVIESVRVDSNRGVTYNNYTDSTSSTTSSFNYGGTNGTVALFSGYADYNNEWFSGDFYWIYMSQSTLTDEQVQQVIDYNEDNGGGETIYPLEYTEKSEPLDNLTFNTMAEAQTYAYNNCVYDGMTATIGGVRYVFDSEEGWVEPSFQVKWLATYVGGTTSSAECDSTSEITSGEITSTNLQSVIIGDCVTSIGSTAFQRCSGLTSCTIGSNVTSIGGTAFGYCSGLTSIDIPDSVTSIDTYAFYECSGMTTCSIGSGVTSIGNGAFNSCRGLTSVDIPNSVTSIGARVFYNCSGLTSVTVNATTPPTLGAAAFNNTNNCPIYVPSASVYTYKTATNWSTYASRIQAIP